LKILNGKPFQRHVDEQVFVAPLRDIPCHRLSSHRPVYMQRCERVDIGIPEKVSE
jgi:hypothetical protein